MPQAYLTYHKITTEYINICLSSSSAMNFTDGKIACVHLRCYFDRLWYKFDKNFQSTATVEVLRAQKGNLYDNYVLIVCKSGVNATELKTIETCKEVTKHWEHKINGLTIVWKKSNGCSTEIRMAWFIKSVKKSSAMSINLRFYFYTYTQYLDALHQHGY